MLKTMNNFILYEQNLKHKQLSRTYDLLRLEDNLNLELKRASKKKNLTSITNPSGKMTKSLLFTKLMTHIGPSIPIYTL